MSILNSIVGWSAELYEPPKLPEALRSFPSVVESNSEQEDQLSRESTKEGKEEENILDPAEKTFESDMWQQNKEKKLLMDAGKKIFALKAKKVGEHLMHLIAVGYRIFPSSRVRNKGTRILGCIPL